MTWIDKKRRKTRKRGFKSLKRELQFYLMTASRIRDKWPPQGEVRYYKLLPKIPRKFKEQDMANLVNRIQALAAKHQQMQRRIVEHYSIIDRFDNYRNTLHYIVQMDPLYWTRYYYNDAHGYYDKVLTTFLTDIYNQYQQKVNSLAPNVSYPVYLYAKNATFKNDLRTGKPFQFHQWDRYQSEQSFINSVRQGKFLDAINQTIPILQSFDYALGNTYRRSYSPTFYDYMIHSLYGSYFTPGPEYSLTNDENIYRQPGYNMNSYVKVGNNYFRPEQLFDFNRFFTNVFDNKGTEIIQPPLDGHIGHTHYAYDYNPVSVYNSDNAFQGTDTQFNRIYYKLHYNLEDVQSLGKVLGYSMFMSRNKSNNSYRLEGVQSLRTLGRLVGPNMMNQRPLWVRPTFVPGHDQIQYPYVDYLPLTKKEYDRVVAKYEPILYQKIDSVPYQDLQFYDINTHFVGRNVQSLQREQQRVDNHNQRQQQIQQNQTPLDQIRAQHALFDNL